MPASWLDELKKFVERTPLVLLKFGEEEWERLRCSGGGHQEFSIVRDHRIIDALRPPTLCLMFGKSQEPAESLFLAIASSKQPVATLESRIKFRKGTALTPNSLAGLTRLVQEKGHATNLKARLKNPASVIPLSPKLGSYLLARLGENEDNLLGMRVIYETLFAPKTYSGPAALQADALLVALRAIGLDKNASADSIELLDGRDTALARIAVKHQPQEHPVPPWAGIQDQQKVKFIPTVRVLEDSVVEHDARSVPGFKLDMSYVTGHAVFSNKSSTLEVFTANKRDLEHCFGVDLIYVNLSKQNIVMLQYKMLDVKKDKDGKKDWIYRPDKKFRNEILKMKSIVTRKVGQENEFRLSPELMYLKFVKRDESIYSGGIIIPLAHYELIEKNPLMKGEKGGLRISYSSLEGGYIRQIAFLSLLNSGYIGTYSDTTAALRTFINAIAAGDKSVVAAIQRAIPEE